MAIARLSTFDNPYDPIDEFERWLSTDMQLAIENNRRSACSMQALFAHTSDNLSDQRNEEEIERAIDFIISFDPTNTYKKVTHS